MSKYDMLIITGLPRSGTTFLNNLFAEGIFGRQYYAHHSKSQGGLGVNPLHLCESRIVGMLFRAGVRLEDSLQMLCNYWRNKINDFEKIIIYKQPQIILQYPFTMHSGWQIKFLVCTRDYTSWRESMIKVNGHIGIHKDSTDSHYAEYWPGGNWLKPENLDDRMDLLYAMFQHKIGELQPASIFTYSSDEDMLILEIVKLLKQLELLPLPRNYVGEAKKIISRYWRRPL